MTEGKPLGMSVETWVDKQIREAEARGEFDNLPGAGKPIPGRGAPDDELWWVKQYMARENLTFALPTTLRLRKEAEDILLRVARERREPDVRRVVAELNERILEAIRKPPAGPPLNLPPLDIEVVVAAWRDGRGRPISAPARKQAPAGEPERSRGRGRRRPQDRLRDRLLNRPGHPGR